MKNGKIFFALAICAVAILGFSCQKNGERTLYLYNWTYYTPQTVIKAFEKEFNCRVKVDSYASNEEMFNKLTAGARGYDIVFPSQDFTSIMIRQGMLAEIDSEKFENAKYINPLVLEKATYDPQMKYSVPYYFGAAGIAVNKTKVSAFDRSWNIFADTRFSGHMSMMDDMREVIGDALATLGCDVNSTNEAELSRARDLINNFWKPNLVKFDAEGFGKSFASGDFWICQGYAEVVYGEVPEKKWEETIDFFIPQIGGPAYLDSMCILKDAPHYELANEFINFIHQPEIYALFLDDFHFPCFVNTEAQNYVKTKPMYEASEMEHCTLKFDIGEDLNKYYTIWQEIRFE